MAEIASNTSTSNRRGALATATRLVGRLVRRLVRLHGAPLGLSFDTVQRILFIRLDHIGDVVMTLPALQALRTRYPRARIDVLVRPGVAPLLRGYPGIDNLHVYDTPRFPENGRGAGLFRTLSLIRRLRRVRYDLAIELRGDDIGRILAYCSGAPLRLGPDRVFYEANAEANCSFLLSHPQSIADEPRHAVLNNLTTLVPLGVEEPNPKLWLPVAEAEQTAVARKLEDMGVGNRFAIVHAHSNDAARDWTVAEFAEVIDALKGEYGFTVLLSGSGRDREYNGKIVERIRENRARGGTLVLDTSDQIEGLIDISGKFVLAELPALFERASLLVTVDTGPMHIAAAVGAPIVALFQARLAPRHHPFGQADGVVMSDEAVASIATESVLNAVANRLACRTPEKTSEQE